MELFRISRAEYQDDLTGIGAFRHGGRWNSVGNAVLYTASHRSLAMLEILVHWQKPAPPPNYVVVVIFVPDNQNHITTPYLIPDWEHGDHWCREAGDEWLKRSSSLLFRVPSVVVKSESNYLINPAHPEASAVKIIDIEPFKFDKRLFYK